MARLTVALICALGAFTAAPAVALATYPGERPANSPLVNELVGLGQSYWHSRTIQPCPEPTMLVADDLEDEDGGFPAGLTQVGGCRVLLDAGTVKGAESHPLSAYTGTMLCTVVVHELGHTAGLLDSPIGDSQIHRDVMAGDPPSECEAWATARTHRTARYICRGTKSPTRCYQRRLRQS